MDISQLLSFKTLISSATHLIDSIYTPRCLCCGAAGQYKPRQYSEVAYHLDVCSACEKALPWISNACTQCALPLPDGISEDLLCGRCLKKQPYFNASYSLFSYEKNIIALMHQLKFHNKLAVSRLFGDLLAREVMAAEPVRPDCLLPVPLFKKRLRQRGFNQSIEISRSLSKAWKLPLDIHSVIRERETTSQTGLDAKQRNRNIKGAFVVVKKLNYQHVAIIDDVVTTTSTVNELSRVLINAGVKKISVYSIARAPLK